MRPSKDAAHRTRLELIGHHMRRARKAAGFTIAALSTKSGYGENTISYMERGISNPSLLAFLEICEVIKADAPLIIHATRKQE